MSDKKGSKKSSKKAALNREEPKEQYDEVSEDTQAHKSKQQTSTKESEITEKKKVSKRKQTEDADKVAKSSKTAKLEDIKLNKTERRVITAEYEKYFLVTTYVPNAGRGLVTLPKRMKWDPILQNYLKDLDTKKPVILCGDLNVAHEEIDLANPKTNTKSAGFTQEERDGMTSLLKQGFVDSFRLMYPDKTGAYTFWSYMGNARARNTGWRLDYFILSEKLKENLCDIIIRSDVYGSDHCPVTLLLNV
ncbi:unnamed protein product [Timema podura]|uniref:exodeoxyribonuclease III n=1 Tax=Timema podura TaxID=61482 RepID=A0ABN7NQ91_TIMPD|nr:unnamed protein product [Timema podura]